MYEAMLLDMFKAHRQISKQQCFEKYCSCDQACLFVSFIGYTLIELFEKPDN